MTKTVKQYVLVMVLISGAVCAAVITGINYRIPSSVLNNTGGQSSSGAYIVSASVGGLAGGESQSASYGSRSGYIPQLVIRRSSLPAADLQNVYIYPSPFKPGTGGAFDAEWMTFKNLTADAEIKIINIAGELVASFDKEDVSVDYYCWPAENNSGEKLASGVYIYFITNAAGEKAKGKFAIIK